MSVAPGQLWAAVPKSLFFVSRVDLGIATVVSVRVTGTGKDAKIVALGKVMRVSVEAMLEAWLPAGMPMPEPRTWHDQLLDGLKEAEDAA